MSRVYTQVESSRHLSRDVCPSCMGRLERFPVRMKHDAFTIRCIRCHQEPATFIPKAKAEKRIDREQQEYREVIAFYPDLADDANAPKKSADDLSKEIGY